MAYLGKPAGNRHTATSKDSFNGDGSTTAFTMTRTVHLVTDIEVFVDNVQQEPTTAYTISGTTLTFDEAPPNGTANVYVIHRSGNNDSFTIQDGTSPTFNNVTITNDGNIGSAGDSDAIAINSSGRVTLSNNLTVDGTSTLTGNVTFTGNAIMSADASVGDDLTLGSDGAIINFGADSDVTLTHVHDAGLILETATDGSTNLLQLLSDDASASAGPYIRLKRTSGSPADNDNGGIIVMDMENDNNEQFDAVQIMAKTTDVSDGTEDSDLYIATMVNGTLTNGLIIGGGGVNHVIPSTDSTYDLGTNTVRFRQAYIDEIDIGDNSLSASAANAAFVGYAGGGSEYAIEVKTDASTGVAMYFLHSTTTAAGSISVASSATAFNTSSDYRLKENVVDMTGAITRLKNLKPKRFNWISDASNELLDGFLAHEVDSVIPQAIHGTKDETKDVGTIKDADGNVLKENIVESAKKDGQTWEKTGTENVYQGIDQSKLVPLLTGALQEAITKIESLEARVAALES